MARKDGGLPFFLAVELSLCGNSDGLYQEFSANHGFDSAHHDTIELAAYNFTFYSITGLVFSLALLMTVTSRGNSETDEAYLVSADRGGCFYFE